MVPKGCVIHSFWHSFRDWLSAAQCPSDIIDQLGGWKTPGVGQEYGEGYTFEVLQNWMAKIDWSVSGLLVSFLLNYQAQLRLRNIFDLKKVFCIFANDTSCWARRILIMRIPASFTFALAALISFICITTPSHAKMLNCERYSESGIRDKSSQLEYDAKYPTQLIVDVDVFKGTSDRAAIVYKNGYFRNTLLSNGKLIRTITNAMSDDTARYKCDMKPEEVLAAQKQ
jgi:hypothetical protein